MKNAKPYWIKERDNPQLGVYYVAMGQMSRTAARKWEENCLYGSDLMLRFDTKEAYELKLAALRKQGDKIQ